MKITISGKHGAGKTSVAKKLAKTLNYDFISVGNLQREIAVKKGMTIMELMEIGKKDKSIHIEMDEKTMEAGKTRKNLIMEGLIAFHFIPHSYKIFLDVDGDVGVKRIFEDERKDEPRASSLEETKERLKKRLENVRESFQKYYKIDFLDPSHYNFIIDTTDLTTQEVIDKILNKINKEQK